MNQTEELFRDNLAFVTARSTPQTADELEQLNGTPASLRIQRTDRLRVVALAPDGRELTVHSPRDPSGEAERQIDAWAAANPVDWSGLVVTIGAGGFHHVKVMAERLEKGGELLVVDPHPASFRVLMNHEGLDCDLANSERVRFIVAKELDRAGREFRLLLSMRTRFQCSFFVHPGLRRAFEDTYALLEDRLLKQARAQAMDRGTQAAFSDEWQQNALINLPTLLRNPGIRAMADCFKGKPAVVVAAGPSLNESLPELEKVQDRVLTIAVGTALKPLLAAGIRPHLLVSVDSDPRTRYQFAGADVDDIYLACSDTVPAALVAHFDGRIFAFSNVLREHAAWIEEFKGYPGLLSIGGTVTVTAIDLAVHCGCPTILLLGLDLAYRNDGRTHADNSMYHSSRADLNGLVPVPGNDGSEVMTPRQFAGYIEIVGDYTDELLACRDVELVNVNTAGAKIRNTTVIAPDQLHRYALPEGEDFLTPIGEAYKKGDKPDTATAARVCKKTRDELVCVRRAAARGLKACLQMKEETAGQEQIDRLLPRLDRYDRLIKRQERAMLLLTGALQSACMHLIGESPANGDDADSNGGGLESSEALYRQIEGGADWLVGLLDMVSKRCRVAGDNDNTSNEETEHAEASAI